MIGGPCALRYGKMAHIHEKETEMNGKKKMKERICANRNETCERDYSPLSSLTQ